MLIKVLKTIIASADETGIKLKEYKAGEVAEIYQDLAEVFIKEKWGIEADQTQDFPSANLETQDLKIALQTKDNANDEGGDDIKDNVENISNIIDKPKKGRPPKNADNS